MTVITPLLGLGLLANMKRDLPQYLVAIYIWKAAISLTLDGNTPRNGKSGDGSRVRMQK